MEAQLSSYPTSLCVRGGGGTTPGGQSRRWPCISSQLAERGQLLGACELEPKKECCHPPAPSGLCSGKGWSWGASSTDLLYGLRQVLFPFGRRLPVSQGDTPDGLEGPLRPAQDCTFWFQKLAAERDALQRELEELKKKLEGMRSRNKVLASEVKTLRSQMGTLVEKGRHDDELIDALMVRPLPEACDLPRPQPRPLPLRALTRPQMPPA